MIKRKTGSRRTRLWGFGLGICQRSHRGAWRPPGEPAWTCPSLGGSGHSQAARRARGGRSAGKPAGYPRHPHLRVSSGQGCFSGLASCSRPVCSPALKSKLPAPGVGAGGKGAGCGWGLDLGETGRWAPCVLFCRMVKSCRWGVQSPLELSLRAGTRACSVCVCARARRHVRSWDCAADGEPG